MKSVEGMGSQRKSGLVSTGDVLLKLNPVIFACSTYKAGGHKVVDHYKTWKGIVSSCVFVLRIEADLLLAQGPL